MNLEKIYICHWKKLVDRKKELLRKLKEQNINKFTFVEEYDKDNWNLSELKVKFPYAFTQTPSGRYLNDSEISLLLKHHKIIDELSRGNNEYALVLEDDVVFCDNFLLKLQKYSEQFPKNWDLIWVGTCCNLHANIIPGKFVYSMNSSRCTHAYMISKKAALKLIGKLDVITEAIDHAYNFYIQEFNLNSYWIEPHLAIQNPNYKTTIQSNK